MLKRSSTARGCLVVASCALSGLTVVGPGVAFAGPALSSPQASANGSTVNAATTTAATTINPTTVPVTTTQPPTTEPASPDPTTPDPITVGPNAADPTTGGATTTTSTVEPGRAEVGTLHAAAEQLNGGGSSFAGLELQQWTDDTSHAPYNLDINYQSNSSGNGRFLFARGTYTFAVSDIQYQPSPYDATSPTFPFVYIPLVAGGIAFMYHLNEYTSTLKLTPQTACEVMTGGIRNWDQVPNNSGLPNLQITPVMRSDSAGTTYVMEQYCEAEAPAVWSAFVAAARADPNQLTPLDQISATQPFSYWPSFAGEETAVGSDGTANFVASADNNGYITAVETEYASVDHEPVASVENASGDYVQPTPFNVASALAYATQNPNGTQALNFGGQGCYPYNPSTYSYLLASTGSKDSQYGANIGAFVNYAATIGQKEAPTINYASLGLSLEKFAVAQAQQVPGDPALSASEQSQEATGDLTPSEVAACATSVTPGVTKTTTPTKAAVVTSGGTVKQVASSSSSSSSNSTTTSAGNNATTGSGTSGGGTAGGGTSSGGTGSGTATDAGGSGGATTGSGAVDPSVALSATTGPLGSTGGNQAFLALFGVCLVFVGEAFRRRVARRRSGAR